MALTPSSFKLNALQNIPNFSLVNVITGRPWTLYEQTAKTGYLVMFICNHCPYVKHIASPLAKLCKTWETQGIGVVGINSNDVKNYPEDSPEKMILEHQARGYSFPYLFDESQSIAQNYGAACTPDFFLADKNFQLVYAGQLDNSRPGNSKPVTGADINQAILRLLEGKSIYTQGKPSMGCNIKWKN